MSDLYCPTDSVDCQGALFRAEIERLRALPDELLAVLRFIANRAPLISGDAWKMRQQARAACAKAEKEGR